MTLSSGNNLVSFPLTNETLRASHLDSPGIRSITAYDRVTGTYKSYMPGISPPSSDFRLMTDSAYIIACDRDTYFEVTGPPPQNRYVDIYEGWNLIGWSNMTGTNALGVLQRLSHDQIISRYVSGTGEFELYIEGISPPEKNFAVVP